MSRIFASSAIRVLAVFVFTAVALTQRAYCFDPPQVVADVNAVAKDGFTGQKMVKSGSLLFFSRTDEAHGDELWKSDGTAAGTTLLLDINPGTASSRPHKLAATTISGSPVLFFYADDGVHGSELWKTDGTAQGTVLVADINPGSADSSYYLLGDPIAIPNGIAFTATDGVHGDEPWISRGTAGTTSMIFDVQTGAPGSGADKYVFDSNLYFVANDGSHGAELWGSNLSGLTVLVNDFRNGSGGSLINELTAIPAFSIVLLTDADDGAHGNEPYLSGGFVNDKVLIKDIQTGFVPSSPKHFTLFNGLIYFSAFDYTHGNELYSTDSTGPGTNLFFEANPGEAGGYPDHLVVSGSKLFFTASTGNDSQVWSSDGTIAGTRVIRDAPQLPAHAPNSLFDFNGTLLFSYDDGVTGSELWESGGDYFSTQKIADLNAGDPSSNPANFVTLGSKAYFTAYSPGRALWQTDGTGAGTVKVADLSASAGTGPSSPGGMKSVGTAVFFSAEDGLHGSELWKTDGTAAGTTLVKDISSGSLNSFPFPLGVVSGKLLFTAQNVLGIKMWISDGTEIGTNIFKNFNPSSNSDGLSTIINLNDNLGLFTASSDGITSDIWLTDATLAGTRKIYSGSASFAPHFFTPIGDKIFFFSLYSTPELWVTDGTAAGTRKIAGGFVNTNPYLNPMVDLNGTAIFAASDGSTGQELWRSDGTSTTLLKDINPGAGASTPALLTTAGAHVFFRAAEGSSGEELWVTDGTTAGTALLKDINPGSQNSFINYIAPLGSKVVFNAFDPAGGYEPWISDGTSAGTVMLKDICPGTCGSAPSSFKNIGKYVFFSATDSANGTELWVTDGTAQGTVLVKDLYPGTVGSFPGSFTDIDGTLYFSATDATLNTELWKMVVITNNEKAKSALAAEIALLKALKFPKSKKQTPLFKSSAALIKKKTDATFAFLKLHKADLRLKKKTNLTKLMGAAKPVLKKTLSAKNSTASFNTNKKLAIKALTALNKAIL